MEENKAYERESAGGEKGRRGGRWDGREDMGCYTCLKNTAIIEHLSIVDTHSWAQWCSPPYLVQFQCYHYRQWSLYTVHSIQVTRYASTCHTELCMQVVVKAWFPTQHSTVLQLEIGGMCANP